MTMKVYVDRSRYEAAQRCMRARFYEYHQGGMGIVSARKPLALCVGSSVHKGLAVLLIGSIKHIERSRKDGRSASMPPDDILTSPKSMAVLEDNAVAVALADFAQYQNTLDAPDAEEAVLASIPPTQGTEPGLDSVSQAGFAMAKQVRNEFDEYLFREQSALVEALVRAYSRRRLRPLLEQFEVLEVEREGEWELSSAQFDNTYAPAIWFMSRPDALLRDRESNQLYLLSYKTTGSWDIRKARDAEHDMQGMSEGIEIERRLAEWWEHVRVHPADVDAVVVGEGVLDGKGQPYVIGSAMTRFLRALDAPPRILAVRMEYLLKGERWKDKELSARFGVEMRSQKSHLIRQYVAVSTPQKGTAGFSTGDVCWAWDFIRDDGRDGNLAWQNWKSRAVFEAVTGGAEVHGGVRAWIDALDDAAETMSGEDSTMGLPPRLLGYKCDAQAVGLTAQHPLDAVFIPPITIYRNDDDVRDMVDQMESQERRIAEGVAAVNSGQTIGEQRHLLNIYFPQTRRACEYPTTCSFSRVCYGSEDMKRDPLASGLYKIRVANHPQEESSNGQ